MTNKVTFITTPSIKTKHAFFTRNGGVSSGIYSSLNCGMNRGEEDNNSIINRKLALNALNLEGNNLVTLAQIHSNKVITLDSLVEPDSIKADAMVTSQPNIILGILTADCCPILFFDPKNNVIGAAHAGWKGALTGIIDNTILSMLKLGAELKNIRVATGPCIGKKSYQVSKEFVEQFIEHSKNNIEFFVKDSIADKYLFDLRAYIKNRLNLLEINNIFILENDTYSEKDDFFSYRRNCHANESRYGTLLSVIALD